MTFRELRVIQICALCVRSLLHEAALLFVPLQNVKREEKSCEYDFFAVHSNEMEPFKVILMFPTPFNLCSARSTSLLGNNECLHVDES